MGFLGIGIFLTGDFGNVITGSLATKNADIGISGAAGGGFATIVSDSQSNSNGSHGITASGEVSNSQANNNGGYGISGVIVTDSTARGNALGGIIVSSGNPSNYASVVDSNASGNSGNGIQSTGNVINSTANNNAGKGIVLFCPVSAFGNAAINNPGGNLGTSDNTCVLLDNKTP
jgi:hypothetical protein